MKTSVTPEIKAAAERAEDLVLVQGAAWFGFFPPPGREMDLLTSRVAAMARQILRLGEAQEEILRRLTVLESRVPASP